MMKKVAKFITKYARYIFIAIILITIFAGMQIKNLKIEDDITKYISQDDPDIKFYSKVVRKIWWFSSKYINDISGVRRPFHFRKLRKS